MLVFNVLSLIHTNILHDTVAFLLIFNIHLHSSSVAGQCVWQAWSGSISQSCRLSGNYRCGSSWRETDFLSSSWQQPAYSHTRRLQKMSTHCHSPSWLFVLTFVIFAFYVSLNTRHHAVSEAFPLSCMLVFVNSPCPYSSALPHSLYFLFFVG